VVTEEEQEELEEEEEKEQEEEKEYEYGNDIPIAKSYQVYEEPAIYETHQREFWLGALILAIFVVVSNYLFWLISRSEKNER
jgi:hypothetical protein